LPNRLGWTKETNDIKIWKDLKNKIPLKYWCDINELLVGHGQEICLKRSPKCNICPINKYCPYYKKTYLPTHGNPKR